MVLRPGSNPKDGRLFLFLGFYVGVFRSNYDSPRSRTPSQETAKMDEDGGQGTIGGFRPGPSLPTLKPCLSLIFFFSLERDGRNELLATCDTHNTINLARRLNGSMAWREREI